MKFKTSDILIDDNSHAVKVLKILTAEDGNAMYIVSRCSNGYVTTKSESQLSHY